MKERPIIFSAEMVKAILDGRKTQTRRVMKPPLPSDSRFAKMLADGRAVFDVGNGWQVEYVNCPYGAPGDVLWVREKWRIVGWGEGPYRIEYSDGTILDEPGDSSECAVDYYIRLFEQCSKDCDNAGVEYDKDLDMYIFKDGVIPTRWRSPIHMPRWASRIALEITNVRVERLQDMSEEDADAEIFGGDFPSSVLPDMFYGNDYQLSLKECYARIWDSLNEKRGYPWSSNPLVWVIEFKRLERE